MLLEIRHRTTYRYEPETAGIALRLKLFAVGSALQQVQDWRVSVNDDDVSPLLTTGFGDVEGLWFARRKLDTLDVVAAGRVSTADVAGVLGRQPGASPLAFLRHTPLTQPDEAIAALAESAGGDTVLERLHALMHAIHASMDFRSGATEAGTTGAQALAIGAGVCQDFSHIFVAGARAMDVPARYVVGYLHDSETPLSETHAWAEAYVEGLGWVGFDAVHEVCPTGEYVRLCCGFDADDAAPIRGTFPPGTDDSMAVEVEIAAAQRQTQQ